jgi:hypothetical protein
MPDTPVEPKPDAPYPAMEMRVSRLEGEVHEMKGTMGRLELLVTEIKATLDATLPHLATKAELSDMRAEMRLEGANMRAEWKGDLAQLRTEVADMRADLKTGLADKPSKTYMWGVLTALLTAYACGLAALAILK